MTTTTTTTTLARARSFSRRRGGFCDDLSSSSSAGERGAFECKKAVHADEANTTPIGGRLFGKHLENGTLNKNGFVGGFGFCFFFLPFFFEAPSCSAKTDDDRRPTTTDDRDDRRGVDLCRYFLRRTEIFLSFFGNIISSTHHI